MSCNQTTVYKVANNINTSYHDNIAETTYNLLLIVYYMKYIKYIMKNRPANYICKEGSRPLCCILAYLCVLVYTNNL